MFEKFAEIISTSRSIKHFDLRDKGVKMDASQTLKLLTALHDSNSLENLQTLHLGHYDSQKIKEIAYCVLSGEGSRDLLWDIVQKARNLQHL